MPSPWGIFGGGTTGDKVSVSISDTSADFLFNKLLAGAGVGLSIFNPGGAEKVQITASGVGSTPFEQEFSATNGQTVFALGATPAVATTTLLWVNGIKYIYGIHYTVLLNVLTWLNDFVLQTGDKVSVYCTT